MTLSVGRFGTHFTEKVANPSDILLFKKMILKSQKDQSAIDETELEELVPANLASLKIEDYVAEFLDSGNKNLELLGTNGLSKAVERFVRGSEGRKAIAGVITKQMNKIME